MARGWESKSIEAQQADAAEPKQTPGRAVTPEQIAQQRRKQTLELARAQTLQQLQSSQNPRHREMLQQALADLERDIQKIY